MTEPVSSHPQVSAWLAHIRTIRSFLTIPAY